MSVDDYVAAALDGGAHHLMSIIGHATNADPQLRADTFQEYQPRGSVPIRIVPDPVCRNHISRIATCYLPQDADVRSADWQANAEDDNS